MGSYFLVLKFGCALNYFFFFNDAATTEIYPLSLHDALPISCAAVRAELLSHVGLAVARRIAQRQDAPAGRAAPPAFERDEQVAVRRHSEMPWRADLIGDDDGAEARRQREAAVVGVTGGEAGRARGG